MQSMNSSLSQTSLQSSNNSRAFDFEGLEESLVDNELNESLESLNELNDNTIECTTNDVTASVNNNNGNRTQQQQPQQLSSCGGTHHHVSSTINTTREQSFHRLRDALIRDSDNRSEDDLDLIHKFLQLIVERKQGEETTTMTTTMTTQHTSHSLSHKDFQTRRLLAKHMVLAEIESRDTRVLTDGERLDAYCVVACGSLRHVISQGGGGGGVQVRVMGVGDEFGMDVGERTVVGEIYTNEDFVWVLCVPHIVFDEICGEKSLKTIFDENNEHVIEMRTHVTNELVRCSRDRLLELLFDNTSDNSTSSMWSSQSSCVTPLCDTNETEMQFISDFLLTFRLFWSKSSLKEDNTNTNNTSQQHTCVKELMEKVIQNLKNEKNVEKNLKIVLFWISNHFQDFIHSKHILTSFESHLNSKIHKKLLYFTLSTKSRERHVTLTRSDRTSPLPFTLVGGYECSSRLFISDVADDCDADVSRGDRLISINGVDCHVMEVSRAVQLCQSCTHLSLYLKFDPNLFHSLIDGQISRNSETKRHLSQSELKSSPLVVTTQQLTSSHSLSSMTSSNNNWKQKVRQIVQNVTTNGNKLLNANHNTTSQTSHTLSSATETPEVIKIYYESDFRYLPIHVTTTARECIQLALIEFQLNGSYSSRDFALYEYKLIDKRTQTSAVKRLSDNYQQLVKNLSLNARIYLRCISGVTNTTLNDSDITREISRESSVNSLLTLDGEAIARELTERDFELFCRIESQQFIYDLMSDVTNSNSSEVSNTTTRDTHLRELKEFELKTNAEMFWTINRVLFESNSMQKRVKAVKQLIRIALECKQYNNYNTLFALLSGLSHQSIERLKLLWERIPNKSMAKLKRLYALMDPSKNFCEFRKQLKQTLPPIIPFFPLVKKDLSFVYLANQTFVTETSQLGIKSVLINWEKMRLLSQKIREVQHMTTQTRHNTTMTATATTPTTQMSFTQKAITSLETKETNYKRIWEKQRMRKRVQHFLDKSFSEIICDENVLFEKSFLWEPQTTQQQTTATATTRHSSATTSTTNSDVMPSPTPSSHSSSPSLSSSTTTSSDIQSTSSSQQSQRMRLRFGVRDDSGLRKLLALSDNCVAVVHNNHLNHNYSANNHLIHANNHFIANNHTTTTTTTHLSPPMVSSAHTLKLTSQSLPQESSSVTSLRRLEQLQQLSRFREQMIPFEKTMTSSLVRQRQHVLSSRPSLPSYDQTIQRMKKKLNKNEENVV